jgi:hypothetical protein
MRSEVEGSKLAGERRMLPNAGRWAGQMLQCASLRWDMAGALRPCIALARVTESDVGARIAQLKHRLRGERRLRCLVIAAPHDRRRAGSRSRWGPSWCWRKVKSCIEGARGRQETGDR